MEYHLLVLLFPRDKLNIFFGALKRFLGGAVLFEISSTYSSVCTSLTILQTFLNWRISSCLREKKQLFEGKDKLFCFFWGFYSDSTNILRSQGFIFGIIFYCLDSSLGCLFTHFRGSDKTYLLGRHLHCDLMSADHSKDNFFTAHMLLMIYNTKRKICNVEQKIQSIPD